MLKTLSMTAAAAAFLATGALAQTTTPPSTGGTAPTDTPSATTPAPGAPGAGTAGGTGGAGGAAGQSGAATSTTTATRTTTVNFVPSQGANELRASNLRGMAVRNAQNENLGDVNDIIMDQSGMPKAVIIGVGGFLGLGEKNVGVPFDALTFTQSNDGTRVARLDVTKDALQNAPTYAYADANNAGGTRTDRSAPRTQ